MVLISSKNNNWRSTFIFKDLNDANFYLIFLSATYLFHQLYDKNNFIDRKGKIFKIENKKIQFSLENRCEHKYYKRLIDSLYQK